MCCLKKIFNKKVVMAILSLAFCFNNALAQFDGQFSQYMNNLSLINPSYVGQSTMIQASIFQRTQWIGMPGAPIVSMLSLDTPFKLMNADHGAGIQFLSDIFGVFNNQQVRLMYSYKHTLGNGIISVGTNIGILNIICYGDSINLTKISQDDGYHTPNDPVIPIGTQTGMGFDFGLGVNYSADNYRIGVSLTHINSPTVGLGEKTDFKISPFIQIHGGYNILTSNEDYKIRTNLIFASDFVSWTSHISAALDIKNRFWIGAGYRVQDALSIMAGIKIFEGFKIGYNFDLPTNSLISRTFGSHELFATYEFSLFREKSKASKSIRIL